LKTESIQTVPQVRATEGRSRVGPLQALQKICEELAGTLKDQHEGVQPLFKWAAF
jgi:hypothetical protein